MNRRFLIAWVVVFIAWMAGSFLVHGTLLHVVKRIIFDGILILILGLIVPWLYRPAAQG